MRETQAKSKKKTKKQNEKIYKLKNNLFSKKPNGITLIALVVTIVVLLILSGITINMLFGSDGLFNIANQAKEQYEIGAIKDRINNVIADWNIQRLTQTGITVDDLWDKMVEAEIITDPEKDVAGPEKEGENDVYQVTTNEGYVVEVIVSPDGNVSIGDVVKGDSLPPKIVSVETKAGTNNIQVTVTMSRWENGTISYYYKKDGEDDANYKVFQENTTELTANIEGLDQNVIYNIKIVAENENGSTEKVVNERTGELKTGTISQKGETIWSNGTATIELETTETGLNIQYQIDGTEGQWLDYEGPITGLNHGETVFAVITDGTNQSGYTTINILDQEAPTVTVTQGTITTNSIQVSVNSSDAQWGMPESITYNYYIKQTSEESYSETPDHTGTETSYTFTGLIQNTSYDVKVTTTDKAGNPGEGQVTNITTGTVGGANEDLKEGNIVATDPVWSNGTASITLSKGTGLASNLTIQYQIGGVTEGKWTTGTTGANSVTVTGLSHNDTVYARLTDGNNVGSYASVDILDGLQPQLAQINLNGTSTTTTGSVTATVTHTDNESGVDIENCRWVYNTNPSSIGTEISSYPNTFSSNGQTITLSASSPATYYLHILTQDVAGNKVETISQGVTVTQLVTGITLNQTNVTLEEGETLQLTATITPSTANNKTVSWSSNKTSVATVSSSGRITAQSEGTATITVRANDESGVTATCNVTVNPAVLEIGSTVLYNPSGTYNWQSEYATSFDSSSEYYNTYNVTLNSATRQSFNISNWKVLSIDESAGTVELVPSSPTTGEVRLQGIQGYNNGVKLLNDACNALYGNSTKGISARSINIEDIEKYMTTEALVDAHSYTSSDSNTTYGNQVSSVYSSSNMQYPVIYAQEKLAVINGYSNGNTGLGLSEQNAPFIERSVGTSKASSIRPYQTYWSKSSSEMATAFKDYKEGANYYNLIMPKGTSTQYWLASRSVSTYSYYCAFSVSYVLYRREC